MNVLCTDGPCQGDTTAVTTADAGQAMTMAKDGAAYLYGIVEAPDNWVSFTGYLTATYVAGN
jgi:hypothetical protein